MANQVLQPQDGDIVRTHPAHTVYTKAAWADDWTEQEHLYANSLHWGTSPGISRASLEWRFGQGMPAGEDKFDTYEKKDILDHYVKVKIEQDNNNDPLVWIGVVAKDFYARTIGTLLRESVNWPAALIFYLMYIGGIVVFVLTPAIRNGSGIPHVALMGGLLGLFAYGTFDLTALALLEGWPTVVAVVDMTWGALLTAGTASVSLWVVRTFLEADGLSQG